MSKKNLCFSRTCWVTSASIACFLCLLQLGAMVSLMVGRKGFTFIAPMALMAALLITYGLARREGLRGRMCWYPSGLTLILLTGSLLISAFFYDFSFDGQWYHQSGIIEIAHTWNPVSQPLADFATSPSNRQLYLRHYAKGPWYAAATIFATTGRLEMGKCINWLTLAAALLGTLGACLSDGWHRSRAFAIAAVVAINPVALSEITSFMVDGVMVSSLVLAVVATLTALRMPRPAVVVTAVASAIVCINSKFTGLIYLCFVLAAVALWCLFKARGSLARLACCVVGTFILGVCIWGYNPYITNTLYRHQPLYPILGSANYPSLTQQGIDGNEKWETPRNMVGRSLPVRFGYAIFSRPGNQPYREGENALLMWPFMAHPHDLYAYTYQETRVAALGPFFGGCLLLSIGLGIWLLFKLTSPSRWILVLAFTTVVASLLISKDSWWPRYAPQLWLLPIIPVAFSFREHYSRLQIGLTWALCALLGANAAIIGTVRLSWDTKASLTLRRQLRDMRDSGQQYDVTCKFFDVSAKERLTEAHVHIHDLSLAKVPVGEELESVVEGYPFGAIRYRVVGNK